MATQTTSYSIAHHILMFLIVCVCIVVVAWILIAEGYRNSAPDAIVEDQETIVQVTAPNGPCAQSITNQVAQMWAYNPSAIPEKYWEMAAQYVNEPVQTRVRGVCNNVGFVCNRGQRRQDCDPCAVAAAMQMAMDQYTADMIATNCPNE